MKRAIFLIGTVFILLSTGCSMEPVRTTPAPVKEPGRVDGAGGTTDTLPKERVEDSGVVIRAYEPSESVAVLPTHSRAVQALIDQSATQGAAGNYPAAVGSLERALRIEPRNAHLWNKLAHLRLNQGQNGLAEELASKSNTLAGADLELKRDNWTLIAAARRAVGDISGARVAERKARMLY